MLWCLGIGKMRFWFLCLGHIIKMENGICRGRYLNLKVLGMMWSRIIMKPVPRDFWIEIFDVSNFGGFDDLCSSRLAWTTFYGIVNNKEMLILQSSDRIGVNKISMDDGQVRKHQCRSFGVRVDGDLDRRRSSLINYINTNSIIRSESSIFRVSAFVRVRRNENSWNRSNTKQRKIWKILVNQLHILGLFYSSTH